MLFRNMDTNEVLSESINFLIKHFGLVAGTILLACVPLFIWQFFWIQQPGEWGTALIYHSARDLITVAGLSNAMLVNADVNGKLVAGLLLGAYVSLIRGGALAHALSQTFIGNKVTPAQAVGAAHRHLPQLIAGNGLLALLIIVIAIAVPKLPINEIELFIFAVIMMAILPRFLLLTQTIMIENVSGVQGIVRSFKLVNGRFWFVFAIWIVVEIMLALLTLVPVFMLGLAQSSLSGRNELYAGVLIPTLAMFIIDPIFDVILVFVYYQLRWRKEGYRG